MATPVIEEEGLRDLLRQVTDDAVRLARSEVNLVLVQAAEAAKRAAVAAALLAVTALLLLLMLIFALAALPERFGPALFGDSWKGWGVVAALFLLAAATAGAYAVRRLIGVAREARNTLNSIKEDVEWVRQLPRQDGRSS
jgi:hypothetical protein